MNNINSYDDLIKLGLADNPLKVYESDMNKTAYDNLIKNISGIDSNDIKELPNVTINRKIKKSNLPQIISFIAIFIAVAALITAIVVSSKKVK